MIDGTRRFAAKKTTRYAALTLGTLLAAPPSLAQQETEEPVGEPPPPQETAESFEGRTVLSPQGTFTFEPSLTYSHSASTTVAIDGFTVLPAIAVGLISLRETQRDSVTAAIALRYGLTRRFEVEVKVPYTWREERLKQRETLQGTDFAGVDGSTGEGLGDVELGARYQLNTDREGPIFIAGLRVKTRTGEDPFEVDRRKVFAEGQEGGVLTEVYTEQPTGSGFYSVQPSLTWIHSSEPAVLYGSFNYVYNIPRDVGGDFGRIEPGSAAGVSFGMGVALNDRTSFSLGYDHKTVFQTNVEGGSGIDAQFDSFQVGMLQWGISQRFSKRTSLGLSVATGVTEEAPDIEVSFRLPMRF